MNTLGELAHKSWVGGTLVAVVAQALLHALRECRHLALAERCVDVTQKDAKHLALALRPLREAVFRCHGRSRSDGHD